MNAATDEIQLFEALKRDLRDSSRNLTHNEARRLVYFYYSLQEQRIRAANQLRKLNESGEPHAIFTWINKNTERLETWVKTALDVYSQNHPAGEWLRSVKGIGPVIAAGLLANIDIEKAPTAGHIWSFAGLNPGKTWNKGEKRPWNADLKTLCWKLGESFVKVSGHEDAFYGQVYKNRKALELAKNEAGEYAEQAAAKLVKFKIDPSTDAYKAYIQGRLPPAHIHARAKRYAVKLLLSHLHEVWYELHHGVPAPAPYVFAHLAHAHRIAPPRIAA